MTAKAQNLHLQQTMEYDLSHQPGKRESTLSKFQFSLLNFDLTVEFSKRNKAPKSLPMSTAISPLQATSKAEETIEQLIERLEVGKDSILAQSLRQIGAAEKKFGAMREEAEARIEARKKGLFARIFN